MNTNDDLIILIGAGGHAKVVYDTLRCVNPTISVDVRDDNPALTGRRFFECFIATPSVPEVVISRHAHVAIGNNAVRKRLCDRLREKGYSLLTVIHPSASISSCAQISEGVFVAAHAVIGPNAVVGAGAIINHSAVVDHDCIIGGWAHMGPNATLGGSVEVGDGALIGAGAILLPGVKVGVRATVGAGAVVTRVVPDDAVVVGVPAREVEDK